MVFLITYDHGTYGRPATECRSNPIKAEEAKSKTSSPANNGVKMENHLPPVPVEVEVGTDWSMPLLAEVYQGSVQDAEKIEAELKQVKEENKALRQEVMKMFQVKGFSSALIYKSDSRTKFYTGLPIYGVFTALVTYLRPKAENLREWGGERETAPSSSTAVAEGLSATFLLRTNCLPC